MGKEPKKPKKGKHACPQCDAVFVSAQNVEGHVRTVHEKRRDHACPQCDSAFGQAQDLQKHMRRQHPDPKTMVRTEADLLKVLNFKFG